jgi:hypothetical protein
MVRVALTLITLSPTRGVKGTLTLTKPGAKWGVERLTRSAEAESGTRMADMIAQPLRDWRGDKDRRAACNDEWSDDWRRESQRLTLKCGHGHWRPDNKPCVAVKAGPRLLFGGGHECLPEPNKHPPTSSARIRTRAPKPVEHGQAIVCAATGQGKTMGMLDGNGGNTLGSQFPVRTENKLVCTTSTIHWPRDRTLRHTKPRLHSALNRDN